MKALTKPTVAIDYQQCRVEVCEQGLCPAAQKCPRKILRQESPYEMPDIYPALCRSCGICIPQCPFGAVKLI